MDEGVDEELLAYMAKRREVIGGGGIGDRCSQSLAQYDQFDIVKSMWKRKRQQLEYIPKRRAAVRTYLGSCHSPFLLSSLSK